MLCPALPLWCILAYSGNESQVAPHLIDARESEEGIWKWLLDAVARGFGLALSPPGDNIVPPLGNDVGACYVVADTSDLHCIVIHPSYLRMCRSTQWVVYSFNLPLSLRALCLVLVLSSFSFLPTVAFLPSFPLLLFRLLSGFQHKPIAKNARG